MMHSHVKYFPDFCMKIYRTNNVLGVASSWNNFLLDFNPSEMATSVVGVSKSSWKFVASYS